MPSILANGIFNGSGEELVSIGFRIIVGSVVVGVCAIVTFGRMDRSGEGKLGCLKVLGAIALLFLTLLCVIATVIGVLYAGCGVLIGN